jgi:hypothetical protein
VDDWLKGLAFGFFGLLVIHGSLEGRARRDARQQVRAAFGDAGQIDVRVAPKGMFGLYAGQIHSVDVYGTGIQTDRLPFALVPKTGTFGTLGHLRLHLRDFQLIGLPIRRFEVDVPQIEYDLSHAWFRNRFVLRRSGTGTASVEIGGEGLRQFLLRKYAAILGDVQVTFPASQLALRGRASLLGINAPFSATANLVVRDGRYVDFAQPSFFVNNVPASEQVQALLLARFNPILDIEDDLGLRGFLMLKTVSVGTDSLTVSGTITVPVGERAIARPKTEP